MVSRDEGLSGKRHDDEARVRPLPLWLRYGAAVTVTVGVTVIARELDPFWDASGRHPYLIEWPTVIAAAWLGGIGPGLVADALATLAILFFWIEPKQSLAIAHPTDLAALTTCATP